MKKKLMVMLVIMFVLSIFSMFGMIRDLNDNSLKTCAMGIECNALGDYQPQSFDTRLLAPLDKTEKNIYSSLPGDYPPPAFPDNEDGKNDIY